jgi:hypothetical protein
MAELYRRQVWEEWRKGVRAITKAIVIVIIFALVGAVIGTAMAKRIEITIREDY